MIQFQYCRSQNIPAFKSLRYDENYASLKNDSTTNWYQKIKYHPLSKTADVYLSIGGDIRFQYFWFKNEDWGEATEDKDGYVLTRYLAHADFHAGRNFRTFIQLQSSLVNSKITTNPVEENPLELHQAFADINFIQRKNMSLVFRIGRQELSYGSQRLISVRELPNNRQSFNAVKAFYNFKHYQFDFFYGNYVSAKKGIFNDGFNQRTKLWGGYITSNKFPLFHNIDFYYLGLLKEAASFDDGTARELRHSIGTRIWSNKNVFMYDAEAVGQWGNFGDQQINAWTLSLNASYQLSRSGLKPAIGLKTELISGNKNYNDGKLQTFNPLFPRGAYFGLAALIGPANLADIHPSLALQLSKRLNLNIDYDIFWRYSTNDGIYAPNVSIIYSGKSIGEKFIGSQYATDLVYAPNNFLYFRAEFTWFAAGSFLKSAGPGKDILFTAFTAQLKF
jgi:hypothetical protein